MKIKRSFYATWYFRLFHFSAKNRHHMSDSDRRDLHTQLLIVLSTGIFMWAYAILALATIPSLIPGMVGIICSTIHLFFPVIYRATNRKYIPANLLLITGIIHPTTFTYFTGGFDSNTLTWLGILPLIAGILYGRRGAILWFFIDLDRVCNLAPIIP